MRQDIWDGKAIYSPSDTQRQEIPIDFLGNHGSFILMCCFKALHWSFHLYHSILVSLSSSLPIGLLIREILQYWAFLRMLLLNSTHRNNRKCLLSPFTIAIWNWSLCEMLGFFSCLFFSLTSNLYQWILVIFKANSEIYVLQELKRLVNVLL